MLPSPSVLDQIIAVLGNLCLRLPDNCARVHTRGGLALIARAMRTHPGHLGLQRSACLALRNIIVKEPARAAAAFDEGFEGLLQQTYMRHPSARDVSYACLRDMGVDYAETVIGRAQAERAARAIAVGDIRVK
jgi:armadillo repeat-containing protein 6